MILRISGLLAIMVGMLMNSVCIAGTMPAAYSLTLLSPVTGHTSYAYAINNAGQVVGSSVAMRQTPTIWSGGSGTSLTIAPMASGTANAINDLGQAVGANTFPSSVAMTWEGGHATHLGVLGGSNFSLALDINNAQQIVGISRGTDSVNRATLWIGGSMSTLGSLGGMHSGANGINQLGQIVGFSGITGNTASHAALWHNGTVIDLGKLAGTGNSNAYDINDLGQIVGHSEAQSSSSTIATLWQGNMITALESLGGLHSSAAAINRTGQIVGYSSLLGEDMWHATVWNGTVATDLNSFLDADLVAAGWVLRVAADINDAGAIVGTAWNSSTNETRGFVLSPVPEPASYAMLILGLLTLAGLHRRSRHASGMCQHQSASPCTAWNGR